MAALVVAGIDAEVVEEDRKTMVETLFNAGRPSALRVPGPWNLLVPTASYGQARETLVAQGLVRPERINPLPGWVRPVD